MYYKVECNSVRFHGLVAEFWYRGRLDLEKDIFIDILSVAITDTHVGET